MTVPLEVWELPHRHVGRRVLRYDAVASTNDLALEPGDAALADVQTTGRGQYGRTWLARPGTSVLMSVRLDPPMTLRRPAVLTAWAAVSVAETILDVSGLQAKIKWPNDVFVQGRKVCGVLIEQGRGVVAGIGLNVNQSAEEFAEANLPLASSLAALAGRSFDIEEIARHLLGVMDRQYEWMIAGDFARLESAWNSRLDLAGRDVIAECFDGTRHRGRLLRCEFAGIVIDNVTLVPETIRSLSEPLAA